jgi:hypothetical protein
VPEKRRELYAKLGEQRLTRTKEYAARKADIEQVSSRLHPAFTSRTGTLRRHTAKSRVYSGCGFSLTEEPATRAQPGFVSNGAEGARKV